MQTGAYMELLHRQKSLNINAIKTNRIITLHCVIIVFVHPLLNESDIEAVKLLGLIDMLTQCNIQKA